MNPMQVKEFEKIVEFEGSLPGAHYLRQGQLLMNCLYCLSPELYDEVVKNKKANCFYDDSKIQAFWDFLKGDNDY